MRSALGRIDLFAAIALAAAFAAMLGWTWQTWPNAFVDFGRELYVPWRINEGDVLYRDLAWFNGPLSAYRNALLFALFGPGLAVLVAANALDVALVAALLWWLLRRVADRLSAFAGALLFLVVFAFSQVDAIGNDNFLTPYSHELTQGIVLGLAALVALDAMRETPRRAAAAAGLLLGLVALTKAEPFVATVGAIGSALWLQARAQAAPPAETLARAAITAVSAGAPVLVAWASLALAMPASDALRGALGAWPAVLGSEVTGQHFYRATLGVAELGSNLGSLSAWSVGWLLAAGAWTLAALRLREPSGRMTRIGVAIALTIGLAWMGAYRAWIWPDALRPLPLVVGGLAILAWRSTPADATDAGPTRAAFLVFSLLLLLKVLLRVRLDQYGFALAMPASLAVVAAALCWLPEWVRSRGGDGAFARAAALGALAAFGLSLLPLIGARAALRDQPLGSGRDAFLADATAGPPLARTLEALAARPANETLAVLPEGVMLNYLARRENPTGHLNFMPPELVIFGEDAIVDAFRAEPPDLVVLTHKDTREYGVGFFGSGYGQSLFTWIRERYRPIARFGDAPLVADSRFGTVLLERRSDLSR